MNNIKYQMELLFLMYYGLEEVSLEYCFFRDVHIICLEAEI
jgi:hypothetical protein